MFQVETGVKGAHRIVTRTFATRDEAEAFAARVRRSNSIGSYWAEVTEDETAELAQLAELAELLAEVMAGEQSGDTAEYVEQAQLAGQLLYYGLTDKARATVTADTLTAIGCEARATVAARMPHRATLSPLFVRRVVETRQALDARLRRLGPRTAPTGRVSALHADAITALIRVEALARSFRPVDTAGL